MDIMECGVFPHFMLIHTSYPYLYWYTYGYYRVWSVHTFHVDCLHTPCFSLFSVGSYRLVWYCVAGTIYYSSGLIASSFSEVSVDSDLQVNNISEISGISRTNYNLK